MKLSKYVGLILLMVLTGGITNLKAQYSTAIGIRGAYSPGISLKHDIGNDVLLEGILVMRWQGAIVTGLYEPHFQAFAIDGLRWFIGGGGHVGIWSKRTENNTWFESNGGVVIGLDVIGGIEYTLPRHPVNFSLDWKPGFNLIGHTGFWTDDAALSIRYVF